MFLPDLFMPGIGNGSYVPSGLAHGDTSFKAHVENKRGREYQSP